MNILTVNLLFSTFVFWLAARIYLLPKLPELRPQVVLPPILLLHAFRHLGLMFLAPGATYAGIPAQLPIRPPSRPAGRLAGPGRDIGGDWGPRRPAARMIFNVEGTADLIAAIMLATLMERRVHGSGLLIPAFWVPALLVTHYITVFRSTGQAGISAQRVICSQLRYSSTVFR
jgi:hypothetical protein